MMLSNKEALDIANKFYDNEYNEGRHLTDINQKCYWIYKDKYYVFGGTEYIPDVSVDMETGEVNLHIMGFPIEDESWSNDDIKVYRINDNNYSKPEQIEIVKTS